ncbi:mitotic-spindle organizing gamma-tubulin ring associated-domain-containing protein [Microdochium trichocladiopsis]|uniref:Mitotic-spindle organizing protein 1 n=1 Tax=Microdochium trichocladiopsis TaxID=1682393 RepID=A0A9P9BVW3_9PEZI|nr:mitotic-spindle organizing gamma-tubulin ring associated-domain-containing protein [Microdochium trichocladiopsis]KAH7040723.1 mitotic-spindle organizing gamma-tubulin ring associated-domain-containing protein [Microdochium trichocladiopsis]
MQKSQVSSKESEKQEAAQQAVDILHEISTILNCHLDRRTLSICISMIENGVNPEALANVVQFMRKELQKSQFAANDSSRANEGGNAGSGGGRAEWK